MTTLGQRIKELRIKMGVNQKEFAEMCGRLDKRDRAWGQSRIGNYETDAREPSLEDIEVLAKALGITAAELAFSNAIPVEIIRSFHYPLLSPVQAGYFTEVNLLTNTDEESLYEMISSQVKASSNAFYLKIVGNSMAPRFQEGDMVLIDPDIYPNPGDFVAALNEDGEATFKKYKETGEVDEHGNKHFNLVPLNDSFGTLSSKSNKISIIGKAVEHRSCL
ncbi:LexA family transcriptional repressor [Canicola haemoglobinophilus]|uniref:Prophage repressor n=1 Tax=Canicola haemoglobinophilus TaxID=733 RepID=A0A1V4B234_9PAST|nr:XRE family transcriptional regulator [Canicola haemoglobinophilus]OOS01257.1 LexA family transcriptional repressor [Canicola haemoglobinophilus]STO54429.1 prophage repressor [Canicola haemoglobinophilus]STO60097.1 prophage repressor [Canicola haemoglobinophilus]STO68963.1 prophage repressor [Canicola haemoglobinophilus]